MKNKELQASLIKSGIILVLCIFFIYAFAVGDSGGITGTIASIFTAFVFVIGLTIAVIVSVVVMFGIYFGILAMYGDNACQQTYEELKAKLSGSGSSLPVSFAGNCCSKKKSAPVVSESLLSPLQDGQAVIKTELTTINNSVQSLEKSVAALSISMTTATEEITSLNEANQTAQEALGEKASTASMDEAIKNLSSDITSLKSSVSPVMNKLSELESSFSALSADDAPDDTPNIQELVASAVEDLQAEIKHIKKSIDSFSVASKEAKDTPNASDDSEPEEHRILAYFSKNADKNKFIKLVAEAVANDMTYAQIGEFLNDSLSDAASEVIADHPSLTKDYIKTCRQKG